MNARIFREKLVNKLYGDVEENFTRYASEDFYDIGRDSGDCREVESVKIDEDRLSLLNPKLEDKEEYKNSFIVYKSLDGMTPYLARDERIWAYLTHGHCLNYVRRRHKIPGTLTGQEIQKVVNLVRSRFFARDNSKRSFSRDNAISCLWWWAKIASYHEEEELEMTLKVLLYNSDLRLNIIDRATTARNKKVFSAIMYVLIKKYKEHEEHPKYNKWEAHPLLKVRSIYRNWLKEINLIGGIYLLNAMNSDDLKAQFEKLADDQLSHHETSL